MKASVLFLLGLITVAEATIGVFVKLSNGVIPVQTLTFYAMALAALFLFIARSLVSREWPRFPRGNVKDTVIIGVLIAAQGGVFNYAMTLVPIVNAVIFWSIAPFFVFIFSALFLGEKVRKRYIAIFVIALAGIVVANPLSGGHGLGNVVALATGVIYAAMITYMRYEGKTETGNDIAWSLLVAALVLSPFLLLVGPGNVSATIFYPGPGITVPVALWVAGLGVVSTGFAYFGISIVLKFVNANVYSLVDIIVSPAVATTLGYLIFAEVPAKSTIYGAVLLLGAGVWLTREMSRGVTSWTAHPSQIAAHRTAWS